MKSPAILPLLLLSGALVALDACVVYDGDCKHCGFDDDSGFDRDRDRDRDPLDDTGKDDTGSDDTGKDDTGSDDTGKDDTGSDDTGEPLPSWSFSLTPSHGEAGQTFLASVRPVGEGAPAADTIAEVKFFGTLTLLATDERPWEYLLAVSLPSDATPASIDMLVLLDDGSVWYGEDLFTVYASGSGHPAGTSDE
jgi:hypothetical protein